MANGAARAVGAARHASRRPGHRLLSVASMGTAAVLGFTFTGYQSFAYLVEDGFDTHDNSSLINAVESTVEATSDPEDADAGNDLNILLMGSDTRDGDNASIGGADDGHMLNDTTILLHISADRTRVEAVSIPRDLQVQISDCTMYDGSTVTGWYGDFNIAFSNGGSQGDASEAAACTINTVQDLTGIEIDHWAVVDFTGFADMVDAIGGVPMCITQDISSSKSNLYLSAGAQVLDGETALAYARLRTAEEGDVSGSDLQRITRQQELLRQTIRTLLGKNFLTDTAQITQFVKAMANSMSMDTELGDLEYLEGLAWSLRGLSIDDVTFATVPWEYTEDFLNVVATEDAETMWEQLRNDEPLTVDAEGDASSEWDTGHGDADDSSATPSPSASESASESDDSSDAESVVEDILAECAVQ